MEKTTGIRLRYVRKLLNLSIESFAIFLGVSKDTYKNWERNKNSISMPHLIRISNKLCINIDFLLGLSNILIIQNLECAEKTYKIKLLEKEKYP